jgi:hypothetical protein
MNLDHPLSASGVEKFFHQSQRLEYLQGTRMNDCRSVPVERGWALSTRLPTGLLTQPKAHLVFSLAQELPGEFDVA